MVNDEWKPLAALGSDQIAQVRQLVGGRGFIGRLTSLGFTLGARVQMLRNSGRGPIIVLVRDTRLALGRGEALKVMVTQKGDSCGREEGQ